MFNSFLSICVFPLINGYVQHRLIPDGNSAYNSNTGYIYDGDLYYCLTKSANNGTVNTYAYVRYSGGSNKYYYKTIDNSPTFSETWQWSGQTPPGATWGLRGGASHSLTAVHNGVLSGAESYGSVECTAIIVPNNSSSLSLQEAGAKAMSGQVCNKNSWTNTPWTCSYGYSAQCTGTTGSYDVSSITTASGPYTVSITPHIGAWAELDAFDAYSYGTETFSVIRYY